MPVAPSPSVYAPPAEASTAGYVYSAPSANQDPVQSKYEYQNRNFSSYSPYDGYDVASAPQKVTTFGSNKAMRTENNIGADGSERSSVKVHHPPGGGGSLNIFGGEKEPQYAAPASYEPAPQEPAYSQPPSYNNQEPSPPADYNQPPVYGGPPAQEEVKQTYQNFSAPPSGFTAPQAYTEPQQIYPSNINMSSAPTTFGQRVESGNNSGPHTGKSSTKIHAPPGGKSSIFF